MLPTLSGVVVARNWTFEYTVTLDDGRRLRCTCSAALVASRIEVGIGDRVDLCEPEPGKGVLLFRHPRPVPEVAPNTFYRRHLIERGLLRPAAARPDDSTRRRES